MMIPLAKHNISGMFSKFVQFGIMGVIVFSLFSYKAFNWKEGLIFVVLAVFLSFLYNKPTGIAGEGELFLLFLAFIFMTSKISSSPYFFYVIFLLLIAWVIASIYRGTFELLSTPLDAAVLATGSFLFFVPSLLHFLSRNVLYSHEPVFLFYQRIVPLYVASYFIVSKGLHDHISRRQLKRLILLCLFVLIASGIFRVSRSLVYYGEGMKYEETGRTDLAEKSYKKSIELNPLFIKGRLGLARIYSQRGAWDKALAQYEWLNNNVFTSKSAIYFAIADTYERQGLWDKAIKAYEQIGRGSPEYPDAIKRLMPLYVVKMNREQLKKILSDAPDLGVLGLKNALEYSSLGNLFYEIGHFEDAIAYFSKALKLKPSKNILYFNLGMSYKELGQRDKAIEAFRKVLDYDPSLLSAMDQLYQLYLSEGAVKEAEVLLARMLKIKNKMLATDVFADTSKRAMRVPYLRIHEAEHLGIIGGDVEHDENASGQYIVHGRSTESAVRDFIFGPFEILPPGFYKAYFRIKLQGQGEDGIAFVLDVYSHEGSGFNNFLARRVCDFSGSNAAEGYQDLALVFYNPGETELEFRISLGRGEILADRIVIVNNLSIDQEN